MKNKESFLKTLQSRLAVLEEAEQQDILAEYAQHIDLRVGSGLTEEEAIRDFGDIDQLTAEILGAYHVKPTYQAVKRRLLWPVLNLWAAVRRGAAGVRNFFLRVGSGVTENFRRLKAGVGQWASRHKWAAWCKKRQEKPFFKRPEEKTQEVQNFAGSMEGETVRETAEHIGKTEAEMPMEHTKKKGMAWAALGRGLQRAGRGLWRLCRGAAWLAWNLFLLLCSLPFAGLGLLALVCLGALVALLFQGYPLVGVTLCCLGGAACCVGVLGLGSGLVWHRAGPAVQAAAEPAAAEAILAAGEMERGDDGR